jgi:hypothetical protein
MRTKRPEVCCKKEYIIILRPVILAAFLILAFRAAAQNIPGRDIVAISPAVSPIPLNEKIYSDLHDSLSGIPRTLVPARKYLKNNDRLYYNSLKEKASRKGLTKKLYDLVIVSPQNMETKKISGKSDDNYITYSGKKIREIEILRIDVFGTSINNPSAESKNRLNSLLNKTHVSTREMIIRKNLLFEAGDTISPLTLSDNERILRELPFINDARIIIVPVSDEEADIMVLTKDVYSLGADYDYGGFKKGTLSMFEKNILGTGHEFGIKIPFNSALPHSPGFGAHYSVNNIFKSFINFNVDYISGLGTTTYGVNLSKAFVSANTRYAGGISVRQTYTTTDLDTLPAPQPLRYNQQDYWLGRSFLLNKESVSRIILGARYLNNNVFKRPEINSESYYSLQRYQLYLVSAAFSVQKYYKTSLIYGYGRTEDIPYGGLIRITAGREFNEFKTRTYIGTDVSAGRSFPELGYFYASLAISGFKYGSQKEQGLFYSRVNYFTNLLPVGSFKSRSFVTIDYSRGIGRYADEYLTLPDNNGFTGFRNDSVGGTQRFTISLESVLFSPANYHGFRFAFFGFSDFGLLSGSEKLIENGMSLISIGVGLRIRNDNLVFNTLQIRLSFFPNPPLYSQINHLNISGEQLLRPTNFDAGKPMIIPFR